MSGYRGALLNPAVFLPTWGRYADRWWHRASSCLATLEGAHALGWPLWQVISGAAVSAFFGGGKFSPDCDLRWAAKKIDAALPDERLGGHGPLGHHGWTHSPWVPLLAIVGIYAVAPWAWFALAGAAAWLWHDLGDALVGRGGAMIPAGIPLWPLPGRLAVGTFKSGGLTGRVLTVCCWASIGWQLWSWKGGV